MLNWLYEIITRVLLAFHSVLAPVFGTDSGAAWGFAIVGLTVAMRLLLFPLFVKQIRAQRAMQTLAPQINELKAKHKGDRETLNAETMKLYREHGANPLMGCLPLLLQMPVFFALFHVLRRFKPGGRPLYGISQELLDSGARAKIFGAPISAAFNSKQSLLDSVSASATTVRVVAIVMVILMGASTYFTQRQMIARSGPVDPQQAMVQKFMLYVIPVSFAFSGTIFPIGVLLYWLTTNIWSMGQQAYVIKRMPAVGAATSDAGPTAKDAKRNGRRDGKEAEGVKSPFGTRRTPAVTTTDRRPGTAATVLASSATQSPPPSTQGPSSPTASPTGAGSRRSNASRAKRKGGRRGGRR